jgi:hypothetical protein
VDRIALLAVGLWFGLLVASSAVATVNFRTVDRLLGPDQRPELAQRLETLQPIDRRFVLRHLVSEVNRWIFRVGSLVQLVLALLLVLATWRAGGLPRALALAALLLTAVQALGLAGAITRFGRGLDFVPRPLPADLARRFGLLHAAYVLGDLAKAGLLVALAALLSRRPPI